MTIQTAIRHCLATHYGVRLAVTPGGEVLVDGFPLGTVEELADVIGDPAFTTLELSDSVVILEMILAERLDAIEDEYDDAIVN